MLKDPKTLGAEVKQFRLDKGWTQKEFAETLRVTDSAVSNWEKGVTNIGIDICEKLADLMGVSLDKLLRADQEKKLHKIHETVSFGDFTIEILSIENPYINMKVKNHTSNYVDLESLDVQLVDNNNTPIRLHHEGGELHKLERNVIIAKFLDSESEIVAKLRFTSIPNNSKLNFKYQNQIKTVVIEEMTLTYIQDKSKSNANRYEVVHGYSSHNSKNSDQKLSSEVLSNIETRKENPEQFKDAIMFLLKQGENRLILNLLMLNYDEIIPKDLEKFGLKLSDFGKSDFEEIIALIPQNILSEAYIETYFHPDYMFEIKDDQTLNLVLEKHLDKIKKEILETGELKFLKKAFYSLNRLSPKNMKQIIELSSKINYSDIMDSDGKRTYTREDISGIKTSLFDEILPSLLSKGILTYNHTELIEEYLKVINSRTMQLLFSDDAKFKQLLEHIIPNKQLDVDLHYAFRMQKRLHMLSQPVVDAYWNQFKAKPKSEYQHYLKHTKDRSSLEVLVKKKLIPEDYLD